MAFEDQSRRHSKNLERQSSLPNQRNVINKIDTCHKSLALSRFKEL